MILLVLLLLLLNIGGNFCSNARARIGRPHGAMPPAGASASAEHARDPTPASAEPSRAREGARKRRERRQRAEARLRLRLTRDGAALAAHRGGPRWLAAATADFEALPHNALTELQNRLFTLEQELATLRLLLPPTPGPTQPSPPDSHAELDRRAQEDARPEKNREFVDDLRSPMRQFVSQQMGKRKADTPKSFDAETLSPIVPMRPAQDTTRVPQAKPPPAALLEKSVGATSSIPHFGVVPQAAVPQAKPPPAAPLRGLIINLKHKGCRNPWSHRTGLDMSFRSIEEADLALCAASAVIRQKNGQERYEAFREHAHRVSDCRTWEHYGDLGEEAEMDSEILLPLAVGAISSVLHDAAVGTSLFMRTR